jgi:hypothetical protein
MNSQSQYGDSLSSALQYHVNQTGVPVTRIAKGKSRGAPRACSGVA